MFTLQVCMYGPSVPSNNAEGLFRARGPFCVFKKEVRVETTPPPAPIPAHFLSLDFLTTGAQVMFLAARMRALQMDPISGNPQKWAQNCFYACTYAERN